MALNKTIDELYEDAIQLVKSAVGISKVIRSHSNGPQPNGEYASILISTGQYVGLAAFVYDDEGVPDELTGRLQANVEYQISVQFYRGVAPMGHAVRLGQYSQSPWGSEWLLRQNVAMRNVSNPLDTSYDVAGKWVSRASINLTLVAATELTQAIDTVGEVTVNVNDEETFTIIEP